MADESENSTGRRTAPSLVGAARRVTATARNAAEVVRYGGLETNEAPSPFTVEAEQRNYKLRHYFADEVPGGAPPILLVPPLMLTTEVWDVSPRASAVATLHGAGLDTWVVDFGRPDRDPGGLERDLADHVLAVSDAVDRIRERTGQDVVLSGYSQGGMFAYQTAAFRRSKGIDSLVTFGSPVDASSPLPIPLSPETASQLAGSLIDTGVLRRVALPGWASRLGFKLLTPAKSVHGRVSYLMTLHDRDKLLPRERQRRFIEQEGWTAWSGPALQQFLEIYFVHNRMLEGGFVIDDRLVTLADIDIPILTVVGTTDTLGHPDGVRAIRRAAPSADVYELTLHAGHFGLVVGSTSMAHTWPAVAAWMRWRSAGEPLPPDIVPADQVELTPRRRVNAAMAALTQASEFGIGATRLAVNTTRRAAGAARGFVHEAPAQLPRLQRIEQLDPSTRISLGLLLDEQARTNSSEICFLFGDRAHRQKDVKQRVDSVVKGLLSVGVRQGDRVGVLMRTRPSAFTGIAALSRLGATSVLLRPDGDLAREAQLGLITWVIADPEHASEAGALDGVQCAVLGGGTDERDLPADVIDLERIDPDEVATPAWYRPNPHRAGDVAFVLFTGEGEQTSAVPISNKRWALSALGTASAAAFHAGDTVYSVTPLHHSSALLMSVGGAVAGGARFAMATADDPDTFWDEVRRYGATHVSYTWTSLRDVTYAPPHANERYNPIRMFIGSGMPRNLWQRVSERFPDARVLEFYASAAGEAILANLTGHKPGSMGRPLPGTPEVRVAAFDLETRRLKLTTDGLARETLADEVGVLLTRVQSEDGGTAPIMRGVFIGGDAWRSTGDLFLRDQQGDHWLAGPVAEIVDTAQGPALPSGTRFCLGSVPGADLVVAFGVPDGAEQVLVGAVTLRPGSELTASDLDAALDRLPARQRPRYVQLVASLPLTTWHRPVWRPLQARGVPRPGRGRRVWRLDDATGRYRELERS
ncbi:MAG TPA: alpha/beta fold hydrolase [Jatrophihabitantaceae bacterium]